MKDSSQLLDLLAAVGSDNIEPTKAVAGRSALYSDVRNEQQYFILLSDAVAFSTFPRQRWLQESKPVNCTKGTSMQTSTTIWRYVVIRLWCKLS